MYKDYTKKYFKKINFHLNNYSEKDFLALVKFTKKKSIRKKIIFKGNGGSEAMLSHFSFDLTKKINI
jgi:hypothetical protein